MKFELSKTTNYVCFPYRNFFMTRNNAKPLSLPASSLMKSIFTHMLTIKTALQKHHLPDM